MRLRAAEMLGEHEAEEPAEALRCLERLVDDPVPIVREAAATSLERLLARAGVLTAVQVITEWSTAPNRHRRWAVARALATQRAIPAAATALELLAEDRSAEVRAAVASAAAQRLQEQGDRRCVALLQLLAGDRRRMVRLPAIEGLEHAGQAGFAPTTVPVLAQTVESTDPSSAERAAQALGNVAEQAPEVSLDALEEVTHHPEEIEPRALERLVEILTQLSRRRPRRGRALLERLGRHEAPWVREAVARALQRIDEPKA